jgi:phytoene desaturase
VFEKIFKELGTTLEKELNLIDCNPIYRLIYSDNKNIDIPYGANNMSKILEKHERGSGKKYLNFIKNKSILYNLFVNKIMNNHYKNNLQLIKAILKEKHRWSLIKSISWSLNDEVCNIVKNPRLRIALMFNVMYCGTSPTNAPAMLGVLSYAEQKYGLQYSKGGIGEISKALWRISKKNNCNISFNTKVKKVISSKGKVIGVELINGEVIKADKVIYSAPLANAVDKEIIPKKWISKNPLKMKMSCSSINLYLGIKKTLNSIKPHTLFIVDDFYDNFKDIFDKYKISDKFCFYIHSVSQIDKSALPKNNKKGQTIVVLAPTPNLTHKITSAEIIRIEKYIYKRISNYIGEDFEKLIVAKKIITPTQWEQDSQLYKGAILGATANTFQMLTFRPNITTKIENFYLIGSDIYFGAGMPLALACGRTVSQLIINEYENIH